MKMVMFCSGKGGVGKSSVAVLVLMALREAKAEVALRDLDPQGTARAWIERMPESGIKILRNEEFNESFTAIDTPSRSELKEHIRNLPIAGAYIVPTTLTFGDQEIALATVKLIRNYLPKAEVYLLFNRLNLGAVDCSIRDAKGRWLIDYEKLDAYAEKIGCPRLQNVLLDRKCYEYAQIGGWKVLTQEARWEIIKLSTEIISL